MAGGLGLSRLRLDQVRSMVGIRSVASWPIVGAVADYDFKRGSSSGAALTTVRSTPGYAQDSTGLWLQFAANVIRQTDRGALVETAATNLFASPLTPATQTVTVVSGGQYTVSLIGSAGSAVLSGAGTGTVTTTTPITFTASTTSLTATVSGMAGTFQFMQCEAGSFKTSPAIGTRAADAVMASISLVPGPVTLLAQGTPLTPITNPANQNLAALSDGTTTNRIALQRALSTGAAAAFVSAGIVPASPGTVLAQGASSKLAAAVSNGSSAFAANGAVGATDTTAAFPSGLVQLNIGNNGNQGGQWNGYVERVTVYLSRLPAASMQAATT